MTLAQELLSQFPTEAQPAVHPILVALARGTDEATTRAHLTTLAARPTVIIEGWDAATARGARRLKYGYRLHIGASTVYLRLTQTHRSRHGLWQLSARPYL